MGTILNSGTHSLRTGAVLLLVFFCLATRSEARVWFVDVDATAATADGLTWETAYTEIQPAIDAAFADGGGEVWVSEGTYDEARFGEEFEPPILTGALELKPGVELYGGFSGTESFREERDFSTRLTIIDGSTARDGEAAYHVIVAADECVLDGFTVTGGNADNFPVRPSIDRGGGMAIEGASTVVRNCIFENNHAEVSGGAGGAIAALVLNGVIENCVFRDNSGGAGGAMVVTGKVVIRSCLFERNSAPRGGGAVWAGTGSSLIDCRFIENSTGGGGGAVVGPLALVDSSVFENNSAESGGAIGLVHNASTVTNCIFLNNTSSGNGGAISASGSYLPYIYLLLDTVGIANCSFYGNSAQGEGGALYFFSVAADVVNCIFWNNGPPPVVTALDSLDGDPFNGTRPNVRVFSSIVEGGIVDGPNLAGFDVSETDPLFADPDNGDLFLASNSPAIDAGQSEITEVNPRTYEGVPIVFPDEDIRGVARPFGKGIDMGAFEFDGLRTLNVNLTISGEGSTNPPTGDTSVTEGDTITITATAANDYLFDHWQGDPIDNLTENPITFTPTTNTTITAVFSLDIPPMPFDCINISATIPGHHPPPHAPDAALLLATIATLLIARRTRVTTENTNWPANPSSL